MKVPFFRPVVPPDVFCLLPEGITYASVRRDPPRGFAQTRHFPFPPNTVGVGASGTPLYTREAVLQSVEAGRRLSDGRLARAYASARIVGLCSFMDEPPCQASGTSPFVR